MKIVKVVILFLTVSFCSLSYGQEEDEKVNRFINNFDFFKNSRYNRVEGVFLGLEAETIPIRFPSLTFISRLGYGFQSEKIGYGLKVLKEFGEENEYRAGVFFRHETGTNDDKIIGNTVRQEKVFLHILLASSAH